MSSVDGVFVWLNDPLNWQGPDGVPNRVLEHVLLSFAAMAVACTVAIPSGALLGRSRRSGAVLVNVANIGRAIPSFAVLVLGVIWLGLGVRPTLVALVLLAVPPMFVLTFTAVRQVDRAVVDSARGMGMAEGRVLRSVQLPVALPLILDGVRLSSSAVIATATLSAYVGGGTLGRLVKDGFAVRDFAEVAAGTLLVVVLVLVNEVTFALLTRFAVSKGLRRRTTRTDKLRRSAQAAG